MTRDLAIRVIIPTTLTLIMASLIYLCLLTVADMATTSKALATDELPRNGCPLDSVRYESPTFGFDCYRVTDRISGESWWLVRMGSPSEWVVMPIEGKVQDMG